MCIVHRQLLRLLDRSEEKQDKPKLNTKGFFILSHASYSHHGQNCCKLELPYLKEAHKCFRAKI